MEKKIRKVLFIPAVVVECVNNGNFRLKTSGIHYDNLFLAQDALDRLIITLEFNGHYKVVRSSLIRKVIEL